MSGTFNTLTDQFTSAFKKLKGKGLLTADDIDAIVKDIRNALLEADVSLPVVKSFTARVKERALSTELSTALNPTQQIVKIVHSELIQILGGETAQIAYKTDGPTVILLQGLQGAGKTTLAGKLALHLQGQGRKPLLVAADLQRPNAVDQLTVVAASAGVPIYAPEPGGGIGDPVQVASKAREYARTHDCDTLIVDTAGRLSVDTVMMAQLVELHQAVKPDCTLLVVDAMMGQDSVNIASEFAKSPGFDAAVLSKADGDSRGGAALSVASVTGRPIMFTSNGEKLTDFEVFHPARMASRILDMGDMLTLIEQAEKAFDEEQTSTLARKLTSGEEFNLEDFLNQLQAVKKMGSLSKLISMMPGLSDLREQLAQVDESAVDELIVVIQSMTREERLRPSILNPARQQRIAKGSGTSVEEVTQVLVKYEAARHAIASLSKEAGLVGRQGMKSKARGKGRPGKGSRRSGNPAKRAGVS